MKFAIAIAGRKVVRIRKVKTASDNISDLLSLSLSDTLSGMRDPVSVERSVT